MADLEEIGLPPSAVERIAVHFGKVLPCGAEPTPEPAVLAKLALPESQPEPEAVDLANNCLELGFSGWAGMVRVKQHPQINQRLVFVGHCTIVAPTSFL